MLKTNSNLTYTELESLYGSFGDSFYLLDVEQFEQNLARFKEAFRKYYPRTELAYSYKTNYIPVLCNAARESGSYAEVVSPLEYEMALRLGNPPNRVVFNGPIKPFADIAAAIRANSIVNLDSTEEYEFVEKLAQQYSDEEFRIGLRCNIGIESEDGSRFGIQSDNGDLEKIFERIGQTNNIRVISLHTHFSHQRSAESYATRAQRLSEIYRKFGSKHPIEIFDLGGGFFGPVSDKIASQFSSPPPTYEQYAAAVGPIVAETFKDVQNPPELVLEPGVGVVANVLSFVCRVESLKKTKTRVIANTTGGVQNIKPSKSRFNLPLQVLTSAPSTVDSDLPVDICGFTCMEDDVMFHGYQQEIRNGDFLVFDNVGAYSITFKPQFIRSAPPILFRDHENSTWQLARRRETVDDILATYGFVPDPEKGPHSG